MAAEPGFPPPDDPKKFPKGGWDKMRSVAEDVEVVPEEIPSPVRPSEPDKNSYEVIHNAGEQDEWVEKPGSPAPAPNPSTPESLSALDLLNAAAKKVSAENVPGDHVQASVERAIADAEGFDDLYTLIDWGKGFQGSTEYYTAPQLKEIIEKVRAGQLPLNSLTRASGLRDKVAKLLNPTPETTPTPGATAERAASSRKSMKFANTAIPNTYEPQIEMPEIPNAEMLEEAIPGMDLIAERGTPAEEHAKLEDLIKQFGQEGFESNYSDVSAESWEDKKFVPTPEPVLPVDVMKARIDQHEKDKIIPNPADALDPKRAAAAEKKPIEPANENNKEAEKKSVFEKSMDYFKSRRSALVERAKQLGADPEKAIRDVGEWYKKQPLWAKLVVSGALIGTSFATGGAGAWFWVISSGMIGQRMLGGASAYVAIEGLLARSNIRGEKWWNEGKMRNALAATAGVLVGSGAAGHALQAGEHVAANTEAGQALSGWLAHHWPFGHEQAAAASGPLSLGKIPEGPYINASHITAETKAPLYFSDSGVSTMPEMHPHEVVHHHVTHHFKHEGISLDERDHLETQALNYVEAQNPGVPPDPELVTARMNELLAEHMKHAAHIEMLNTSRAGLGLHPLPKPELAPAAPVEAAPAVTDHVQAPVQSTVDQSHAVESPIPAPTSAPSVPIEAVPASTIPIEHVTPQPEMMNSGGTAAVPDQSISPTIHPEVPSTVDHIQPFTNHNGALVDPSKPAQYTMFESFGRKTPYFGGGDTSQNGFDLRYNMAMEYAKNHMGTRVAFDATGPALKDALGNPIKHLGTITVNPDGSLNAEFTVRTSILGNIVSPPNLEDVGKP